MALAAKAAKRTKDSFRFKISRENFEPFRDSNSAFSCGIYGAFASEPAETVEAAMTTVRHALTNSDMQKNVQDQVREFITTHTTVPHVISKEKAPATSLEINVVSIELDGLPPEYNSTIGVINPALRLVVTVEARLSSNSKGALYTATFQYWGQKMTMFEWESNDAQPVRDEIARATVSLAEQIVDGVFLLYRIQ